MSHQFLSPSLNQHNKATITQQTYRDSYLLCNQDGAQYEDVEMDIS
jgi:hypothetical protein